MLKKRIIIIPLEGSWDHSADFLRQTALQLSKTNLVYIYDQNNHYFILKKNKKKLYPIHKNIVFNQVKYYLPFERFRLIDKINQYLSFKLFIKSLKKTKKILWIFYPNYYNLAKISDKNIVKIYDCVDYSEDHEKERILIDNVDYFFVNSKSLKMMHKNNNQSKEAIFIDSQGFYQLNKKEIFKFKIMKNCKKAIIGFVGGINYRLDYSLLNKLIVNHPEWMFVFFGPEQEDVIKDKIYKTKTWINKLKKNKNTLFSYSSDRSVVYGLINNFDVAIIPYNIDLPFNRYCYPMKIFEYFYLQKPIVSSGIIELKSKKFKKYIKIANSYEKWEKYIKELINKTIPNKIKIQQTKIALENSWQNKIIKILKYID